MKRIWSFLLFVCCYQPLMSHTYIDSLDLIIEKKLKTATHEPLMSVVEVAQEVNKAIVQKISFKDLYTLLQSHKLCSFFLLESSPTIQEIKFALGAKMYIYCLDYCEQKMLHKAGKNSDSLEYWEHELFYENRDFLQKNITRWVHDESYIKFIRNKIADLKSISKQTSYFLGLILHHKDLLSQASNREMFEKNLMKAARLQDIFLNSTERDYENCDMYSIVTCMIQQFHDFSDDLSAQYAQCQPPHHFERNWVAYTSTAVGLCACAVAYYLYQDQINNAACGAYQAGISFWDAKVQAPVVKMMNTVSGVENEPLLDTKREEIILHTLLVQGDNAPAPKGADVSDVEVIVGESSKLLGQATTYAKKATTGVDVWGWFGYEKENPTVGAAPLANQAQSHSQVYAAMTAQEQEALRLRVADKDGVVLAYPKANLNEAFPALERSALSPIVELQRAVNTLYEENQLMLGLVAMFPVMSLAGGAAFASKKAYSMTLYKPICKTTRDLEIFLNDSVGKPVSFDREGQLFFLTELLKKKCGILTLHDLKLMEEDIAELQSRNLIYAQKFNVVQRMYRTYAFLLPGAV